MEGGGGGAERGVGGGDQTWDQIGGYVSAVLLGKAIESPSVLCWCWGGLAASGQVRP